MSDFGTALQPLADELIQFFGGGRMVTLRRYVMSGNVAGGKKSRTWAETVEANAVIVDQNVMEVDGWTLGDKTLLVSASGFTAKELDGRWTVQEVGGEELPLGKITPVKPGGQVLYYGAVLQEGASGGE